MCGGRKKNVRILGPNQKFLPSGASFHGICLPPSGIILVGTWTTVTQTPYAINND
jgi:hypothetical protein